MAYSVIIIAVGGINCWQRDESDYVVLTSYLSDRKKGVCVEGCVGGSVMRTAARNFGGKRFSGNVLYERY